MELIIEQGNIVDLRYKNKKTLFLDVEGVLNHTGGVNTQESNYCINEDNAKALEYILDNVEDLVVVLSSSWRRHRCLGECKRLVNYYFGLHKIKLIGRTPLIPYMENGNLENVRGHEIQHILDLITPSEYVILDNREMFLEHQLSHHIKTVDTQGLTMADAQRVVIFFNGQ